MRAAFFGTDQRAIVHDHGQRRIQLERHGHGKVEAAPGDQRHLDAAARRFSNCRAVGLGKLPAAIKQRAVYIQGDQSHGHSVILPWIPCLPAKWNKGEGYPTPGCFSQRVRNCMKTKGLSFWCVQKSLEECERKGVK